MDGSYTDRRHPDSVHFTRRIEEDLSRRDFTVNAIAFDPRVGLVDPFFGREDLENKILRAVGDPALRFEEDALRIMRAFRFSATLNFEIERETLMAARDKKEGLRMVARERIATELLKLLCAPDPRKALRSMVDAGVLQVVTDGYAPSEETVELMSKMPPMDIARLGAFLLSCDEARAREILDSLRLSSKQKTGAMAVFRGASERVCGAAEARRFSARYGAYAPYAIEAAYLSGMCDRSTLEAVRNNTSPCRIKDLDISGEDLLSMGIRGKAVGDALEMLLEAVLTDPSLNKKDRLLELIRNKKTREGQNERA